jgi:hypothetical protein
MTSATVSAFLDSSILEHGWSAATKPQMVVMRIARFSGILPTFPEDLLEGKRELCCGLQVLSLRDVCTKWKNGRKAVTTEHHGRQRAHRAAAKSPDFQCDYRRRRNIGGVKNEAWIQAP